MEKGNQGIGGEKEMSDPSVEPNGVMLVDPDKPYTVNDKLVDHEIIDLATVDPQVLQQILANDMDRRKAQIEAKFFEVWKSQFADAKVSHKEFFITAAMNEQGHWFAVVMRPANAEEFANDPTNPFVVVSQNTNVAFTTSDHAKQFAARTFPTLPVLMSGDTYFYPEWEVYDRKRRIKLQAEARRVKRGLVHKPNEHQKGKHWRRPKDWHHNASRMMTQEEIEERDNPKPIVDHKKGGSF